MADPRVCAVDGCGKKSLARGWCSLHYQRWRHHRDPVGGGTFQGEPERFYREVVLNYEGDDCLTWPFGCVDGYGAMAVDGIKKRVARLVCEHRNGAPPTPDHETAHSCGRGQYGCVSGKHVSWKTHAGNMADKITHGTLCRGERCGTAKLTENDVRQIRSLKGVLPNREIAAMFQIKQPQVSKIHNRKTWIWLD